MFAPGCYANDKETKHFAFETQKEKGEQKREITSELQLTLSNLT